jgi:poly(3-hydroxybutyrate) depolymerase
MDGRAWALLLLCTVAGGAGAQPLVLPSTACAGDRLFFHGLEDHEQADPSNGAASTATGSITLSVFVPALGASRPFHLRVPPGYDAQRAWPLLVALHGSPGSPALADPAAQAVRDAWAARADAQGFIVLAPVASGPSAGGWNPPGDDAALALMQADVEQRYNIDRRRRLLWGFSAGGHYGHGVVLSDTPRWAAYAVNAGVLQAYAGIGAPSAAARRVPVSIRVGDVDPLQPLAQADASRFLSAGWQVDLDLRYGQFGGGHTYDAAEIDRQWDFLCRFARP